MPKPYDFGSIEIDMEPGAERGPVTPDSDAPFRILVIGDFTGRASRGYPPQRPRPILVDRDNYEHVMARLAPSISLDSEDGRRISIAFRDLDDFHPDRLFEKLELFRSLRQLRDQLGDPGAFRETADQLQPPPSVKTPDVVSLAKGRLLDDMIEATESRPPLKRGQARGSDPIEEYVRKIVAPHIVPKSHPKQAEMIAQVDEATSSEMRALLRHPHFQVLEAVWRGLFFLVRNVETGSGLKIYLLDMPKAEMGSGAIGEILDAAGDERWSLLVADATFGAARGDLDLLSSLGKTARKAGAALLAAGDLAAIESEAWQTLRSTPQASYIGLALPRMLLRLPYGKQNSGVDQFDFEEMPQSKHDAYLWGNPAFACASLIAACFTESGWEMRPGQFQEVSGLPIHTYTEDGETRMKPCAELWLTQREVELLLEQGIMPLISIKDSDRIRVGRIQSIRTGAVPLAGQWS